MMGEDQGDRSQRNDRRISFSQGQKERHAGENESVYVEIPKVPREHFEKEGRGNDKDQKRQ